MNITQEKLINFASEIEDYDLKLKELRKEKKEFIDQFAEDNEIKERKPLLSAVKAYLTWKKDRSKFYEESNALDQFIDILTGEKCIPESNE